MFENILGPELLLDLILLHLYLQVIDVEYVKELNHVATSQIHDVQTLRRVSQYGSEWIDLQTPNKGRLSLFPLTLL